MSRCSACPQVNSCVPASGPINSDLLFIGEAPNADDDKGLVPFIGKTGKEVNEGYLPTAGLKRFNCRFDNVISCMPNTNKGKLDSTKQAHKDLASTCFSHRLVHYINYHKPKAIVAMGVFANYVLDEGINLTLHHGIPQQTKFGTVFPMFHPAGGLHEPKKMLLIRTDWFRLKQYLAGKLRIAKDQYPDPDYAEIDDPVTVTREVEPDLHIAIDTEWSRALGTYCLSFSQYPGMARVIMAGSKPALKAFNEALQKHQAPIIFQNYIADDQPCRDMGLDLPLRLIEDTMVQSFNLGNTPQGLKAAAYRELGMVMEDFEDVVKPWSSQYVMDYYYKMMTEKWPKPEPQLLRDDNGKWKTYAPHGLNTKIKTFFTYLSKSPDTKDIFENWDNWEEDHEMIEERLGKFPGLDIAHVPHENMLFYSARDADATLRWYFKLKEMRNNMAGKPQELWRK